MRMRLVRQFVAISLCTWTCVAWSFPARRALVIGNDSYPGNSLQNARNDAKSISEGLTALGYASTLALDVDHKSMTLVIDKFAGSLANGDTAMVYYAGHGLQVEGENYLVPVDFRVSDQTDVKYQGYALSALLQKLTEHGATTQIIILDACRDNPFLGSRSTAGGWASVGTSAGSFLAFGTAPGSTASDDPSEGHGLFTKSLLKFLPSQLDVEQMFQLVRKEVIQKSNGHQVPWTASSLIGSFHVDPRGDANVSPLQDGSYALARTARMVNSTTASTSRRRTTVLEGPIDAQQTNETQLLNGALTQISGSHFDQALGTLGRVLSIDPQSALALRLTGVALHLSGRDPEAAQALDRAIQLDSKDALAYSYRCLMTVAGNPDASAQACRDAIRIREDLPQAHLGLAMNLLAAGKLPEAYVEATTAISLEPTSVAGFSLRGDIATAEAHRGLAQLDYIKATRLAVEKTR